MLDLSENKKLLLELQKKLESLAETLQISKLQDDLKELEKQTLQEDFWQDSENSSKVYSKMSAIQKKIKLYNETKNELENLIELNELLILENDKSLENDLEQNSQKMQEKLDNLETEVLLSGKYDQNNAIITIHPGAGRNRIAGLG